MTITRERIAEISEGLKRWYAKSLDATRFAPEEASQFHHFTAHGLNECLAYIEQMESGNIKYPD